MTCSISAPPPRKLSTMADVVAAFDQRKAERIAAQPNPEAERHGKELARELAAIRECSVENLTPNQEK